MEARDIFGMRINFDARSVMSFANRAKGWKFMSHPACGKRRNQSRDRKGAFWQPTPQCGSRRRALPYGRGSANDFMNRRLFLKITMGGAAAAGFAPAALAASKRNLR